MAGTGESSRKRTVWTRNPSKVCVLKTAVLRSERKLVSCGSSGGRSASAHTQVGDLQAQIGPIEMPALGVPVIECQYRSGAREKDLPLTHSKSCCGTGDRTHVL